MEEKILIINIWKTPRVSGYQQEAFMIELLDYFLISFFLSHLPKWKFPNQSNLYPELRGQKIQNFNCRSDLIAMKLSLSRSVSSQSWNILQCQIRETFNCCFHLCSTLVLFRQIHHVKVCKKKSLGNNEDDLCGPTPLHENSWTVFGAKTSLNSCHCPNRPVHLPLMWILKKILLQDRRWNQN